MPIFEYRCKKCEEVFEVLVRGSEKPQCPKCKSKRLEKLISTFNASAQTTSSRQRRKLQACRGECCGSHQHTCCGGCCGGCGHS